MHKEIVTSDDGTPIAVWCSGVGPPLLLVHGSLADHTTSWPSVLPSLSRDHRVYAMDRRGRGGSGDAASYDLQREAQDVAAVVEWIGTATSVLGHSHGALCSLEAALLTPLCQCLVLYEGVPLDGREEIEASVVERIEAAVDAGDHERALEIMLFEIAQLSTDELNMLRAQTAAWFVRLSNARTMARELRALSQYRFRSEKYQNLTARVLFLVGQQSPPREHANAERISTELPDATVRVLAGQEHLAMHSSPGLFVYEVLEFTRK